VYTWSRVDGDVFEYLSDVVLFNVIVVNLRECCAPQAKLSVDLDLTCSSWVRLWAVPGTVRRHCIAVLTIYIVVVGRRSCRRRPSCMTAWRLAWGYGHWSPRTNGYRWPRLPGYAQLVSYFSHYNKSNKNLAIANRSHVSCAHYSSRASIGLITHDLEI